MTTRRRFYLVTSTMILAAILLFLVTIIPTLTTLAAGDIPFVEHTIAGDFDGAWSVYATDLDGDGDVDVLGAADDANDITWWENDGSENFTEHTIDSYFDGANSVYAIDVDGDDDVDVLGAASDDDDIAWWENDGSENFTEHTIDSYFDGANSVYAIDVDGDGNVDVLGAAYSADSITWWENDGDENFTEHTVVSDFDGARSVYATDVDGDGDMDVLGAAYQADDITWWENDGSENFTEHTIDGYFDGARSVYATDLDSDGDVDILGAALSADDITWWENDGDENFTEHTIDSYFDGANSVYAIDVDGDGNVDVLGASLYDYITWWENDGDENFTEHTVVSDFDGPRSVYATDVNGDGGVDILGAASAADDITWWEQTAVLSIHDASVTEGDSGSVSVVFSVTLSITSTQAVTVEYTTADGSAIAPSDYTAIPTTTLVFPPGVSTQFITVSVQGDTADELDEIFWVNLANPVNADLSDAQGQGTILDDDLPTVSFSSAAYSVTESVGQATITVTLGTSYGPTVTVDYTASNGTAMSGIGQGWTYTLEEDEASDFPSPETRYTGPAPSWDASGQAEGTYYYRVRASSPQGDSGWSNVVSVTVGPPDTPVLNPISNPDGNGNYTVDWNEAGGAQTYILEEDDNSDFSSPTTVYSETGTSKYISGRDLGTYWYRVRASNAIGSSGWSSPEPVTVTVACSPTPGSWSGSGSGLVGSVSFSVPSDSSRVCSFKMTWIFPGACGTTGWTTFGCTSIDSNCQFSGSTSSGTANFSWSGEFTSPSAASGTWRVTDSGCSTSGTWWATGPSLQVEADRSITNGDRSRVRSAAPQSPGAPVLDSISNPDRDGNYTVSWTGGDYAVVSGTLTFAPGETIYTFTVPIADDTLDEADETISLALGNPSSATLGAPYTATLTILDDDPPPTVQFSSGTYSVDEGAGVATITATLSAASGLTVTVGYTTTDGTAIAPDDYTAVSDTLTFIPGETVRTFTVPIADDVLDEEDETVHLALGSPSNATLGTPSTVALTIVDDDLPTVQLSSAAYSVDEYAGNATITVTLSAVSGLTATVDYAASDGTAVAPGDYTVVSDTLTFAPGETTRTFTIPIANDALYEEGETVNLALGNPSNAILGIPYTATLTILDDDPPPTVQFSSGAYSVGEDAGQATVTVNLSAASGLTVTVVYTTSDGTATAGEDYTAISGTLVFTPGVTSRSLTVDIIVDEVSEDEETVMLTLSSATNAIIGDNNPAVLTITEEFKVYLPLALRQFP